MSNAPLKRKRKNDEWYDWADGELPPPQAGWLVQLLGFSWWVIKAPFSWAWRQSLAALRCPGGACHAHDVFAASGTASGQIDAPDHAYPSHLELEVTATDAAGLTDSETIEIYPRTTTVSVRSDPPGVSLTLDGDTKPAPFDATVIVGSSNDVEAPASVTLGGEGYVFAAWSDGGARAHAAKVPEAGAALTARFSPDADHDGVLDAGETDPADPDTDGDGICDHPRADNESDGISPVDS